MPTKPKPATSPFLMSFKLSKKNSRLVELIAKAAVGSYAMRGVKITRMDVEMDLAACHNHAVRLDFEKLLKGGVFNMLHDVEGIRQHLDRKTGALKNCFSPRSSLPDKLGARYLASLKKAPAKNKSKKVLTD
jgi:hypothetical protein